MNMNKCSAYAPWILRIGLGFVFIWFGWSGLTNTAMWTGLVPEWLTGIAPAETLVKGHAIFELVFGLLLCAGIWTRWVAILLLLNLIHTITLLNYGPVMIRDIGLAAALLAIAVGEEK